MGKKYSSLHFFGSRHQWQASLFVDHLVAHGGLVVEERTLQEYRSSGTIGYYLICGKILYKESEVERMLRESYREGDGNALPAK